MREASQRNRIHARRGHFAGAFERDAARSLGLRNPFAQTDALAHHVARHVVEHDPLGFGPQRALTLRHAFYLHLDGQSGKRLARRSDGQVQAVGIAALPQAAVIVLA